MTDTSTKANSQKAAILAHLRKHGHIDSKTSRNLYGCEALRSRIADLRKAGHEIETRMVAFVSRYGHPGRYGVYVIKGFEEKIVEQTLLLAEINLTI